MELVTEAGGVPTPGEILLKETGMDKEVGPLGESPVLEKSTPEPEPEKKNDHPEPAEATKVAPPTDDGTDWKKRHGDAVRWAQQMKTEREKFERQLNEFVAERKRLEEAGLDFEEINKFIESQGGTPKRSKNMDTSASEKQNFVTSDQLNNIITKYNYDMAKRDFADANPDFRDTDTQELLDIEATKIANEQFRQYGSVTAPIDEIIKDAAKKVTAKVNKFKEIGAKSVTETRTKIKEAAIPEGQSIKKETEGEEEHAFTNKDYFNARAQHSAKLKQRGSR